MVLDDTRHKARKLEAQITYISKFIPCFPLNVLELKFIKQCFRGCNQHLKMPLFNKQEIVKPNASMMITYISASLVALY